MSVYTCLACRVAFVDASSQRNHYKTDWHRYNLKRKVAELPPVTAENFKQRVVTAQQQVPELKTSTSCSLCGKHFSSVNAFENHVKSKKHKEAEAKGIQKAKEDEEKLIEKNAEKGLNTLPSNEAQILKDLANKALKDQLQESGSQGADSKLGVTEGGVNPEEDMDEGSGSDVESMESWDEEDGLGIEECLFCSNVSTSLEDSVKHMTVNHSFFLPDIEFLTDLEGLITYLGQKVGVGKLCLWCNERGKRFHTAKAAQQHMLDKGHCKMLHEGATLLEYTDFYDYRSSYPDYREAGEEEGEEEVEDGEQTDVLAADGYELVLPSGAVIGHRSLMKYYKQSPPQRSSDRTKKVLPRMLAQYKALGWTGTTGPVAHQRVKDLGAVQRLKMKHHMKQGVKANKFQPHLRPQVVF